MPQLIPDPALAAKREADFILAHPQEALEFPVARVAEDSPGIDLGELMRGIDEFHHERMSRRPSATAYPEAAPWVDYVLSVNREVQERAGLSDHQMAVYRSLNDYLTFRGFRGLAKPPSTNVERCRVAFIPDTDRGPMHIKNVDDPATVWRKKAPVTGMGVRGLAWDGVGSGLHIDDEPTELFPLPIVSMCVANCDQVPDAVEFLTRYKLFWGRANVVLFDARDQSVAIEKCSYTQMQVYQPGPDGRSHVSGMACRDPMSPIAVHQKARRDEYLRRFNLPGDGADSAFWASSDEQERRLGEFLKRKGPIPAEEILALFTTPVPEGLNKNGWKYHPDQAVIEYTLMTFAKFFNQQTVLRWQRDDKDLSWPKEPEVYQF